MISGIGILLFIWLGGFCLGRLVGMREAALDCGLALGTILLISIFFIGGMLGLSLNTLSWFALFIFIVFVVASFFFGQPYQFSLPNKKRSLIIIVSYTLPIATGALLCWYGLSRGIHTMPGVEIHGLKAKIFLTNEGLGSWFYNEEGWRYTRNHYPPGFSLVVAFIAKLMGGYDHNTIRIVPLFYLCALLWLTQRMVFRIDKGIIAWVLPSLLFMSQQFADLARYYYAEPCMFYLGLIGLFLLLKADKRHLWLGMLCLVSMGWIKNEGLIQAALIIGIYSVYLIASGKVYWKLIGRRLLGCLIILPWIFCLKYYGLGERTFDWSRISSYFSNVEFHQNTLSLIAKEMFWGREIYSGVWWAFLAAILMYLVMSVKENGWRVFRLKTNSPLLLFLVFLVSWSLVLTVIFHCSLDPTDHARAIWRLWMLPTIIATILTVKLIQPINTT